MNYEQKMIKYWSYHSIDKELVKKLKDKNNYISEQLKKSKIFFWKILYQIYFKFFFLLLLSLIYFCVTLYLNLDFERNIRSQREGFGFFIFRGWIFDFLLILYRELGFNFEAHYDTFQKYLKTVDEIENQILIISSSKARNYSEGFLYYAINSEIALNSNQICGYFSSKDKNFFYLYQRDCDEFYKKNNGLKDGIKIVTSCIKNEFPYKEYYNMSINEQIYFLSKNISFIKSLENYINKGIILEINSIEKNVNDFMRKYYNNCLIRICIFSFFIIFDYFFWVYIIIYLIKNLNKDQLILTLIPNEALSANRNLLISLKKLQ